MRKCLTVLAAISVITGLANATPSAAAASGACSSENNGVGDVAAACSFTYSGTGSIAVTIRAMPPYATNVNANIFRGSSQIGGCFSAGSTCSATVSGSGIPIGTTISCGGSGQLGDEFPLPLIVDITCAG